MELRDQGNGIVCVVIRNLISLSTPVLAGYDFFARGQNRIIGYLLLSCPVQSRSSSYLTYSMSNPIQ